MQVGGTRHVGKREEYYEKSSVKTEKRRVRSEGQEKDVKVRETRPIRTRYTGMFRARTRI
jgi:hypothetical protein